MPEQVNMNEMLEVVNVVGRKVLGATTIDEWVEMLKSEVRKRERRRRLELLKSEVRKSERRRTKRTKCSLCSGL